MLPAAVLNLAGQSWRSRFKRLVDIVEVVLERCHWHIHISYW